MRQPRSPIPAVTAARAQVAVFTLAGAWAGTFSTLASVRHQRFLTHAFDTGQMVQALWMIRSHGGGTSTITGVHLLGDHARFILYPLALLVPPAPGALSFVQALGLASGAPAVYYLTRRLAPGGSQAVPVAAAGLYLALPTVQWMSWFEFHPEVLALPLLLWALAAAVHHRWRTYWVLIVVALLCREDVAVAVALVGVVLAVDHGRRRAGLVTMAVAGVSLAIGMAVMAATNPHGLAVFEGRYGWLGASPVEAARTLVGDLPASLFVEPVLPALAVLGLALYGALPFAAAAPWRVVWIPLPLLAANAFSGFPQQRSVYFHYMYLVVPLLVYCAARGLQRVATAPRRTRAAIAVVTGPLIALSVVSFSPFTATDPPLGGYVGDRTWAKPRPVVAQLRDPHPPGWQTEARHATALVGDGEPVSAGTLLVPRLARREEIHMYPNPFYPKFHGEYLATDPGPDVRVAVPALLPRWVLVDRYHVSDEPARAADAIGEILRDRYVPVFEGMYITAWRLASADGRAAA